MLGEKYVSVWQVVKTYLILLLCLVSIDVLSNEPRKRILIIDTGIRSDDRYTPYLCKDGHRDLVGQGLEDIDGHGTSIFELIIKDLDYNKYCVTVYKWWHREPTEKGDMNRYVTAYIEGLAKAVQLRPAFLNLSLTGDNYIRIEEVLLKTLMYQGTKIAVAAGNQGTNLDLMCTVYPGCHRIDHIKVVTHCDKNGKTLGWANQRGPVTNCADGVQYAGGRLYTGTSQSTAVLTNLWARGLLKEGVYNVNP